MTSNKHVYCRSEELLSKKNKTVNWEKILTIWRKKKNCKKKLLKIFLKTIKRLNEIKIISFINSPYNLI